MNSERFRDPDPPTVGEVERQAVRQRARRIRRQQRLRLILPTAVVAAAVVGVAIPLAGLHSTPGSLHPAKQSPTALSCDGHTGHSLYDSNGVRFVYPSCWTATTYEDEPTSFSDSLVDLSNQTMHAPCTTTTFARGNMVKTITCHLPLSRLDRHGILVQWSAVGFPGGTFDKQPGTLLTVGGRPARERISGRAASASTSCGSIGADESIWVTVERTVPDNYYYMMACIRGPDTAVAASEVRTMLASTTFADQ